jgi:ABC-type transport system involved in multi-copper enzyme maturation permease subunit
MRLTGLSPFGPIFGKELRTASRRKRNYLLRVLYLGGLLLFLLLAYTITRTESYGGTAARAQAQEQLGRSFFTFFALFCAGAMALVGPVVTSTAINGERQAKTLHVLLMTPLTAWQIVSGKLFSRLLTPLTLIGLSLPVLALVRLLGGVELWEMFGVIGLCAALAMFGAGLGLLFSILNRRAYAVILLAYFLMAVLYFFAPVLLISYLAATGNIGRMPAFKFLGSYNPFYTIAIIAMNQSRMLPVSPVVTILGHVAATGVLLTVSSILVRRLARREGEGSGLVLAPAAPADLASDGPLGGATAAAPPPLPMASRRQRVVWDFPVAWRELHRPLMAKRWQRVAAVLVCLGMLGFAYAAAYANNALRDAELHILFACIFYTLLMVLTCVLSATCVAQEKEAETWTVLLASPLSGGAIVWGKALGVLRRLLWPAVLALAHFLIFTLSGAISPAALVTVVSVTVCFNLMWVATGVVLSLRIRKVAVAVIVNLALPVVLYGVGSLVLAIVDELLRIRGELAGQTLWYLPYFYLVQPLARRGGLGLCELPPGRGNHVTVEAFAGVAMVVAFVHAAVAAGILSWTAAAFNRVVGRASQRDLLDHGEREVNASTGPSWAPAGP